MSQPNLIVKAFTVWQPWGSLFAHYAKDIENRGWALNYRGPVLIHAGAKLDLEHEAFIRETVNATKGNIFPGPHSLEHWARQVPRSCVVAVATLAGCSRGNHPSPWAMPDSVHWEIKDVEAFKTPEIYQGRQGLWDCEVHRFNAANYEHVRAYIAGARRK